MDKKPAKEIIAALKARKAFDGWWGLLEKDNKEEIIEEIASIIDRYIEFNYR